MEHTMISRAQHTTTSQQWAKSLLRSLCVKRQYLGLGTIETPATSSAFDCSLVNPEEAT